MRTIALPKRDGGGIDVLDATRCVAEMTTLLPMMLAEDYRPASIVSLAERKAAFESLKGSVETGDSAESLLLAELARQVSAISARLQDITSVLPAKPEKPTPGSWFTVSGMIAGRDGWLSCRSCDYGESFEPALGDRPEATCPECGASSAP